MQIPVAALRLTWPAERVPRTLAAVLRVVGVLALLAVALIHITLAGDYFMQSAYIGVLFYLAAAGAGGAAILLAVGVRGGWILGALIAAGAMLGLILATTVGLPGFVDSLVAPHATQSLFVEGIFLVSYAASAITRRSPWGC